MKHFLLFLLMLATALALVALLPMPAIAQNAAVFPGATVTPARIGVAANSASSTLLIGIGTTDTTLNVGSTAGFKAGSFVSVDSEILAVCAIPDGTHLTLGVSACPNVDGRGLDTANGGGSAVAHLAGAAVQGRIVANHVNQLAAEVIATETRAKQILSLTDFGADPTDTTDSTAAFQIAASSCQKVRIPNGTYLVSGTVQLCRSTQFVGMSRDTASGTVIDARTPNNLGPVFLYTPASGGGDEYDGIAFRDFTLSLPENGSGIQIGQRLDDYLTSPTCPNTPCYQAQTVVHGVEIEDVDFMGNYISAHDANAGTTVAPSMAEMVGRGICLSLSHVFTSTVTNSHFHLCGIGVYDDQNSDENKVSDSRFDINAWNAVLRGGNFNLHHNSLLAPWRNGSVQLYKSLSNYGNHITQNVFEQTNPAAYPASEYITSNGDENSTISENWFIDPAAESGTRFPGTCIVRLDPAVNLQFIDNQFGQGGAQAPTKPCIGITNYNQTFATDRIVWTGNTGLVNYPNQYTPIFPQVRTAPFDPYVFGFDKSPYMFGSAVTTFPWALDPVTNAWTIGSAQPEGYYWRFPLRKAKDREFYLFFNGRQVTSGTESVTLDYQETTSILITTCTNAYPMVCTIPGHGVVGSGYAQFAPNEATGAWTAVQYSGFLPVTALDANTLQFNTINSTGYGSFSGQTIHYATVDQLYSAGVTFASQTALNTVQVITTAIPAARLGTGYMTMSLGNQASIMESIHVVPVDELPFPYAKSGANTDITSLYQPTIFSPSLRNPTADTLTVTTIENPSGQIQLPWQDLMGLNMVSLNGYDICLGASCATYYVGTNSAGESDAALDSFLHVRGYAGVQLEQNATQGYAPVGTFTPGGAILPQRVLGAARPAVSTSTKAGPYTLTSSNNQLYVQIDGNAPVLVTLPTGSVSAATVVGELNLEVAGQTATVSGGGGVTVTTTSATSSSQVEWLNTGNSALSALGFTAGFNAAAHGVSHTDGISSGGVQPYGLLVVLDATAGTYPCANTGGTGTGHLALWNGTALDCR